MIMFPFSLNGKANTWNNIPMGLNALTWIPFKCPQFKQHMYWEFYVESVIKAVIALALGGKYFFKDTIFQLFAALSDPSEFSLNSTQCDYVNFDPKMRN